MKRILVLIGVILSTIPVLAKPGAVPSFNILPKPQSVETGKGTFKASGAAFSLDQNIDRQSRNVIERFANRLTLVSGKTNMIASPVGLSQTLAKTGMKGFVFLVDSSLAEEEYSLEIKPKSLVVKASGFHGFLYAIQTIRQLLPVEIFGTSLRSDIKWTIPCAVIKDRPRFGYRGMHLDCARHFFSVDEVKKYLDMMALYKMNTFHWHLTEDQGWRIEIKKYPLLTEIGAFRDGTVIGRTAEDDGIRYGGYYTQEQIKDIVSYAGSLGITVIPEIDLPGHMLAALASYPELGCTGGPYSVSKKWGIFPDVLCPGKDKTFDFLEDVFTELMELFPSEYIHIGGDECPKTRWKECPDCQARIKALGLKDGEGHTAEQLLQNYVTARVQKFLNDHGRKIIGWDEILEGELAKGATVMSWRGVKGGVKAAGMGFDVIMTPNTYCYFDYYQTENKDNEPLAIGGLLPIEKVWSYDPYADLPESARGHILGVQANLWTEYIGTPEYLEYMALPRAAALSEVQWCQPSDKDWESFKGSVKAHTRIYEKAGYNYRKLDF